MQYHFKYNDQVIRLIGIPAFGILIPTLTGLNSYLNHPGFLLGLVSSVVFIFLSFLIWQGNKNFLLNGYRIDLLIMFVKATENLMFSYIFSFR